MNLNSFSRKLSLNNSFTQHHDDKHCDNDDNDAPDNECSRVLTKILMRNKLLTQLNMRHLDHVVDTTLHCVPRTLTHIDIGGCGHVTDVGVRKIAANCPRLSSISLSKTKITDRSLSYISTSRCRATLREIRLNGCVNITDAGIEVVLHLLDHLYD